MIQFRTAQQPTIRAISITFILALLACCGGDKETILTDCLGRPDCTPFPLPMSLTPTPTPCCIPGMPCIGLNFERTPVTGQCVPAFHSATPGIDTQCTCDLPDPGPTFTPSLAGT